MLLSSVYYICGNEKKWWESQFSTEEKCVLKKLGCLKSSLGQPTEVKHLHATEVPLNHYFSVYTSEVEMTFKKSPRMYPDFNKYYS